MHRKKGERRGRDLFVLLTGFCSLSLSLSFSFFHSRKRTIDARGLQFSGELYYGRAAHFQRATDARSPVGAVRAPASPPSARRRARRGRGRRFVSNDVKQKSEQQKNRVIAFHDVDALVLDSLPNVWQSSDGQW
jgi:hypothetical protein